MNPNKISKLNTILTSIKVEIECFKILPLSSNNLQFKIILIYPH